MMVEDRLDIDARQLQVAAEPAEHVDEGVGIRSLCHGGLSPAAANAAPEENNRALELRGPFGGAIHRGSVDEEQPFHSMEHDAGKAADEHAVEADILQVPDDVHLDAPGELGEVPALDLIGDEMRQIGGVSVARGSSDSIRPIGWRLHLGAEAGQLPDDDRIEEEG